MIKHTAERSEAEAPFLLRLQIWTEIEAKIKHVAGGRPPSEARQLLHFCSEF